MLHLPLVQAILADGIKVAAQNCSANPEGAFTGEVSADALSDYRIKHVLIGHSERRNDFNEGQEVIDAKMQ
jgi:triosephosphate isomerase (TIM)